MLCQKCGNCAKKCEHDAISFDKDGYPIFNRSVCLSCEKKTCEQACSSRAIKIVGTEYLEEELFNKIKSNSLFFRNSNGGVTLSGGEPLAQPEFVANFAQKCFDSGISVGIETCGYFDWEKAKGFIDKFDFYYYDIKCMNEDAHLRFTSKSNNLVKENLKRLAKIEPSKIIVTVAVIPHINDSDKEILEITSFCKSLGISKIRLLPYHSYGKSKYHELGRNYLMDDNVTFDMNKLKKYVELVIRNGIDCWIE